jgi:hypothetical protein
MTAAIDFFFLQMLFKTMLSLSWSSTGRIDARGKPFFHGKTDRDMTMKPPKNKKTVTKDRKEEREENHVIVDDCCWCKGKKQDRNGRKKAAK